MILDDKIIMFPPPPPYLQAPSSPSLSTHAHSHHTPNLTLTSLPAHILLEIISYTFPPVASSQNNIYQASNPERQRKTLLWLSTHLRLVSRQLYTACMHVLRSTYLPAYLSMIRPPYTSDPFPLSVPASSFPSSSGPGHQQQQPGSPTLSLTSPPAYVHTRSTTSLSSLTFPSPQTSPLLTLHRETPILDRFIALKVRQDVFADDTELHTDREDAFRDLFDVAQPRARLEDLVRVYGVREGVVSLPGWVSPSQSPSVSGSTVQPRGQAQPQSQHPLQRIYSTESQSSASSSLGSIPVSPLPSSSSSQKEDNAYTYTLDPSLNPTPGPHPSSPSTRLPKQQHPQPTQTHPKPRRSFFSMAFGKSSSPSPSPSSSSKPQPSASSHPRSSSSPQHHPQTPPPQPTNTLPPPIPFQALSISFSPRRIGLVLNRSRTIAEVPRLGIGRERETLEVLARGLVAEMKAR